MDKHKNNGNYFQLHPHRHTGSCRTDETETSGDLSCLHRCVSLCNPIIVTTFPRNIDVYHLTILLLSLLSLANFVGRKISRKSYDLRPFVKQGPGLPKSNAVVFFSVRR